LTLPERRTSETVREDNSSAANASATLIVVALAALIPPVSALAQVLSSKMARRAVALEARAIQPLQRLPVLVLPKLQPRLRQHLLLPAVLYQLEPVQTQQAARHLIHQE
jgi:hypothetical protein